MNIKPWESLLKELREGNERIKWINREPYAYWKGNPSVAETRQDLMKCNVSEEQEWDARLYAQVITSRYLILLVTTAISLEKATVLKLFCVLNLL